MQAEQWDVIVIGSGLGGLACAAYLAAAGRRTLVLESHYVAGGNSQVFRRRHKGRAYEFDVGLHYIGECGPEGTITRILRGVAWPSESASGRSTRTDSHARLSGSALPRACRLGPYRARLLETFPDEGCGSAAWSTSCARWRTGAAGSGCRDGLAGELAKCRPAAQWGLRPITELFDAHGLSPRARAVLLGESGTTGYRPPARRSALQAG